MDWNDFPKKEIYWTITKDCNLCCADCYYSAYPGGETASLEHIKAMIDHFPRDMKVIHISGGEVLKTFDTLMYALPGGGESRKEKSPQKHREHRGKKEGQKAGKPVQLSMG